jgi:hypothetical protein
MKLFHQKKKKNIIIPLEQQFIDKFPVIQRYNFSPTAGSPLGFKHSAEAIKRRLGKPAPNKGMK